MSNLALTEPEREAFLAGTHIGVLSVVSGGERPPLTVPIWYGYEPGGNITFFTDTQGRKARKTRLIQKAGVVSFMVQREEFPYSYVTVEGTLVQTDKPPSADQVLAIVRRYLPEEQAQGFVQAELSHPASELILFTIRPDRWLTADFGKGETKADLHYTSPSPVLSPVALVGSIRTSAGWEPRLLILESGMILLVRMPGRTLP